jgi:hypothetical protein
METNTYEFWLEGIDMHWLPVMDEVWVLMDADWDLSKGVAAELRYACDERMPVRWVSPTTMDVIGGA